VKIRKKEAITEEKNKKITDVVLFEPVATAAAELSVVVVVAAVNLATVGSIDSIGVGSAVAVGLPVTVGSPDGGLDTEGAIEIDGTIEIDGDVVGSPGVSEGTLLLEGSSVSSSAAPVGSAVEGAVVEGAVVDVGLGVGGTTGVIVGGNAFGSIVC